MSKSNNVSSAKAKETRINNKKEGAAAKRTRNFATVVYPDSAPED